MVAWAVEIAVLVSLSVVKIVVVFVVVSDELMTVEENSVVNCDVIFIDVLSAVVEQGTFMPA